MICPRAVTSFFDVDKYTKSVVDTFSSSNGRMHFSIVAPPKTCQKLRGNIYATCVNEEELMGDDDKTNSSKYQDVLRVARDFAGLNVQWIGFMKQKGDVSPGENFPDVLDRIRVSEPCSNSRCMLCGQRHDPQPHSSDGNDHQSVSQHAGAQDRRGTASNDDSAGRKGRDSASQ